MNCSIFKLKLNNFSRHLFQKINIFRFRSEQYFGKNLAVYSDKVGNRWPNYLQFSKLK